MAHKMAQPRIRQPQDLEAGDGDDNAEVYGVYLTPSWTPAVGNRVAEAGSPVNDTAAKTEAVTTTSRQHTLTGGWKTREEYMMTSALAVVPVNSEEADPSQVHDASDGIERTTLHIS